MCNENKLIELHGEPTEKKENKQLIVCSKRHRWMKKKTVADVVEALIGAYLEDAGELAALAFMEVIGIEATTEYQEKLAIHSLSDENLALIRMINISAIEELLSYSFRHKGLLIEAFTHASFITHHSSDNITAIMHWIGDQSMVEIPCGAHKRHHQQSQRHR